LVLALAASGRRVSLDELSAWRRDGLLPPFPSQGVKATGRSYYWSEPDIQARAEAVHDAFQRHGRADATVISLWLRGFEVPLPQVRRAWLHGQKRCGPTRIRRTPAKLHAIRTSANGLPDLLLTACDCAAISIDSPFNSLNTGLAVFERAAAELGYTSRNRADAQAYWHLAMAVLVALGPSDAVSNCSDEDMKKAQRHLQIALKFVLDFRGDENVDTVVDSLGPPIFLFIVTLLRSGQRGLLETILNHIAAIRREPAVSRGSRPHAIAAEHGAAL